MEPTDRLQLARELVAARKRTRTVTAPSTSVDDFTLADAYAVAELVAREWARDGHHCNGVKIGLTNRARWSALGISEPIWGRTYTDTTVDGNDVFIDMSACVDPRIEAEILVGIERTLGPGASAKEVSDAVGWAALGFELVDSHIASWKVKPEDLVADFGTHAGLVIGTRRRVNLADIAALGDIGVELTNGTVQHAVGKGDAVLGGPVAAIVAHLATSHAAPLGAGSVVSTGALTGQAHPITAGEQWRLEPTTGPLPGLHITLTTGGQTT